MSILEKKDGFHVGLYLLGDDVKLLWTTIFFPLFFYLLFFFLSLKLGSSCIVAWLLTYLDLSLFFILLLLLLLLLLLVLSLSLSLSLSLCLLPGLYHHYQQRGRRQFSGWAKLVLPLSTLGFKLATMWVGSDLWCLYPHFLTY